MDGIIDIRGISRDDSIITVTVRGLPEKPGSAYHVFGLLAGCGIDVDIILQSISEANRNDIVFTVGECDKTRVREVLEEHLDELGAREVIVEDDVSKVSVAGVGMKGTPGVAARVFRALYDCGVELMHISTSEVKISLLMRTKYADSAMQAIYSAFNFTL